MYAEFASVVPVAGSAYTFSYASLGELIAWIIGWDLMLELALGAVLVFFAYIGFDIVATNAEETRRPQRDVPIGIFASLGICTVLYIAVSLVITGMVKYNHINVAAPLATAFQALHQNTIATSIAYGRWPESPR